MPKVQLYACLAKPKVLYAGMKFRSCNSTEVQ
jgi:hypothetical protein